MAFLFHTTCPSPKQGRYLKVSESHRVDQPTTLMPDFCHLHCHTQYSLLDGAARIERLLDKAAAQDAKAIAISDHGNLYGVPEFCTAANKRGIKPIIGCEFYLTSANMAERKDRTRYHQILFATSEKGYQNLIKLSSLSFTEGYYYKPRIDHTTLARYSGDLIATTCCLQGEVPQTILRKGEAEARKLFEWYLDVFGDNYYIELQDHGIEAQHRVNAVLLRWADEYGVRVMATNDVHYVERSDAEAHDVLLCIQTRKDLTDPTRMRFDGDQFYLKSTEEMRSAFTGLEQRIVDEALDNTLEIADKCNFKLGKTQLLMPQFPIPSEYGNDMDAYLESLVFERAQERYPELTLEIEERLRFELDVIREKQFAGYFLVVQDFTTEARKLGVSVGPGRGSAAGSAVAYALGITNVEPLRYRLLFERFLNPERESMPDIDIDFDDRGRGDVIDYVVEKYGREAVCQIVTFGTLGARSAIRDVARVLGLPIKEADRIANLVPESPKPDERTISAALERVPEFKALAGDPDGRIQQLIKYAQVLEGAARHTGVHAAGVIIAPGDVSDYVPVAIQRGKTEEENVIVTQYEGKLIEKFGLLKMDFLGLRTLTIINDAVELIAETRGNTIDPEALPLDDATTFELFQRGETVAIFQFESEKMREYLRELKPTSINDLIAMNALYRPGPMRMIPQYIARKHGKQEVTYPHEMLKEVLDPTYGIPIYQEQVMQMAQIMGGYSLGQADLLRRAMGKKDKKVMEEQRKVFIDGAKSRGVEKDQANEIFDTIAEFAGYGFNKSHSAAYSLVAYQTGYLKAHYPAEFMAAVLRSEMNDSKKLAVALSEVRRIGLEILPPSINKSFAHFTVENDRIRFGLAGIRGVGEKAVESIIKTRKEHGPFENLEQLCRHLDLKSVNRKVLECLAGAGAFDGFEGHRAQFVEAIGDFVQYASRIQAEKLAGQHSLFNANEESATSPGLALPLVDPWPTSKLLKTERELVGFYLSGHPLENYTPEVRAFSTVDLAHPDACDTTRTQRVCAIITEVNRRTTRNGRPMAFLTIEDFSGQGEAICFSPHLDTYDQHITVDAVVMITGEATLESGVFKIKANDIIPMQQVRDRFIESIVVRIDSRIVRPDAMQALEKLCNDNRGNCKLYFDVQAEGISRPLRIRSRSFVVDPSPELMRGILRLFGHDNVVLEGAVS